MSFRQQIFAIICLTLWSTTKLAESNVLFHFGFDFSVNDDADNSTELGTQINKTIELHSGEISVIDNLTGEQEEPLTQLTTSKPITDLNELQAQQIEVNEEITAKLLATKSAIENLKQELTPLVGRSDFMAGKVKSITRYLNTLAQLDTQSHFQILENFINLVDELKATPTAEIGGERSLEFVLMKLALEKHGIIRRQLEARELYDAAHSASETWARYVKQKLVEVAV